MVTFISLGCSGTSSFQMAGWLRVSLPFPPLALFTFADHLCPTFFSP